MRIILISDTHNQLSSLQVPEGDILIHSGDATNNGSIAELSRFGSDLARLPHKNKLVIAGNHDWIWQKQPSLAKSLLPPGVTYLEDSGVIIDGVKFWGSPWQPEFCGWAFNLPRGEELKKRWAFIPDDTNVLITHGPPAGILDQVPDGEAAGCEELWKRICELKYLKLHTFGHLHHSYGMYNFNGTTFVNASSCDERYNPVNKPVVIDL